ncbi:MAG: outer membrane lipoprotein carrier protein LolA, partial [Alicyclobacillus sp.]|nr:outer membrane lipoprotein carrier protein LolA [Alicyclobacillus sp.]
KATAWVLAVGLVIGVAAGCGLNGKSDMVSKLQTEQQQLTTNNYTSTATMTVQMDNAAQTYHIQTWYESPDVYKIALGDANKNINQIIVHNQNGMFIVSPALQKVFRFNGNWAQNQGHIYLYDQILSQIIQSKDAKMTKQNGLYVFDVPMSSTNDVVTKEHVEIDARTMYPKRVILYDNQNKAVVTIDFKDFKTNVKFDAANDFDPHKLVSEKTTKPTMTRLVDFGYIEPDVTFGDKLSIWYPSSEDDTLLRYAGDKSFTLDEWRPTSGVDGLLNAQLVDLFGVPAMYTGTNNVHQLIWVNNGVEFALTSSKLSLDEMRDVAISTFGQSGK